LSEASRQSGWRRGKREKRKGKKLGKRNKGRVPGED